MGPRAWSLAADKVAIGGGDRTLASRYRLTIGGKAHGAAWLAPFKARPNEDAVQAFRDRVTLDVLGARHHPGPHSFRYLAASEHGGRGTQVGQAAVGA